MLFPYCKPHQDTTNCMQQLTCSKPALLGFCLFCFQGHRELPAILAAINHSQGQLQESRMAQQSHSTFGCALHAQGVFWAHQFVSWSSCQSSTCAMSSPAGQCKVWPESVFHSTRSGAQGLRTIAVHPSFPPNPSLNSVAGVKKGWPVMVTLNSWTLELHGSGSWVLLPVPLISSLPLLLNLGEEEGAEVLIPLAPELQESKYSGQTLCWPPCWQAQSSQRAHWHSRSWWGVFRHTPSFSFAMHVYSSSLHARVP